MNLLLANQSNFHARHRATLQGTWLTEYVTINFNNSTSMTAEFLDTEKSFDTTRHFGLSYNSATLQFSPLTIKHITSCRSIREFVEFVREMSAHKKITGSIYDSTVHDVITSYMHTITI